MRRERDAKDGGEQRAPPRSGTPRAAYREYDDVALVDAMGRGDERAVDEFVVRFERLLHDRVRRWRTSLDDADAAIYDILEEIALSIVNGRVRPTRSIATYVLKSFRTRLARRALSEATRVKAEEQSTIDAAGSGERVVHGLVSESTLRASYGPNDMASPVSLPVARLVGMIEDELSEEERRVLAWLSNYISQREICDWLGVSYAAGTQRIWRLRERLREAVQRFSHHFDFGERSELYHFFRRVRMPIVAPPASPTSKSEAGGGP